MKNILFLDYDSDRVGDEIKIGKPNHEPSGDKNDEIELLKSDITLLSDGLIKLISDADKYGYLDKSMILDKIIEKFLKEKYDKSRQSDAI